MVTTIRCPNCGTLSNEGVDFCPVCDTFLPWTEVAAQQVPTAAIELAVPVTHLDVEPGGEASLELKVRNTGRNVDRVDFDVVGATDGWTVVEPGSISLLPGAGAVARLVVRPPRDASVPAGQHLLELHARSAIDATLDVEQRISVDVAPFDDVRIRMTPPTSRGTTSALHRVVVENTGNHPVTVTLDGRDRDGAGDVAVSIEPSVIELPGGDTVAATATVTPGRRLVDGPAIPRPFVIVAHADGVETTLDGVMLQEPVPPAPPAPAPPAPPVAAPVPTAPVPRRRRRWPLVLLVLAAIAGLVGAAVALVPVDELFDQAGGGDGQDVQADAPPPEAPPAAEPAPEQDDEAVALPELTIVAVECALVPEAGEVRFAVQVANRGGELGDPVTITAVAGDRAGSTEVVVDGLATGVFGVPISADDLGTELTFTIAIDPDDAVEEADEGNNAGDITITLPPAADQPVSLCG
jgi:hypothetical protein